MLAKFALRVSSSVRSSFHTTTALNSKFPKKKVKELDKSESVLSKDLPVVALVGKPNVGKSALFNRLLQRSEALVRNTPDDHVTRDFRRGLGRLGDLRFQVLDTSGLEPLAKEESIQARTAELTSAALCEADAAVILVDARAGVTYIDHSVARWLQANAKLPLVLAANKAERGKHKKESLENALHEARTLGLGEPVAISAETGEGMVELYNELQPLVDRASQQRAEESRKEQQEKEDAEDSQTITVAIVGLPNAGKSSLMNRLLNRGRSLTGPEVGLTRDAVSDSFPYNGQTVNVIDTAGWLSRSQLRRSGLAGDVTTMAHLQTQRSYNKAHIVLLVVDATVVYKSGIGLTRGELSLATHVIREGRALIVVLNKLDAVPEDKTFQVESRVENQLQSQLSEVQGSVCLGLSALTGAGVEDVMPAISQAYAVWNQRVSTSTLNKWLVKTAEKYAHEGATQIARVRYVVQVGTRPPSFVAFVSGEQQMPASALKFLGKSLRQSFGFDGVPLRISVRMRRRQKRHREGG